MNLTEGMLSSCKWMLSFLFTEPVSICVCSAGCVMSHRPSTAMSLQRNRRQPWVIISRSSPRRCSSSSRSKYHWGCGTKPFISLASSISVMMFPVS